MQTLLVPAGRAGIPPPSSALAKLSQFQLHRPLSAVSPSSTHQCLSFTSSLSSPLSLHNYRLQIRKKPNQIVSAAYYYDSTKSELSQVSKRLEKTSRYFKRLGSLGFWGQLVLTIVSAVILSFSAVITGKVTSPATFYATAAGIAAGFLSVFWSFGYIRLSDRLRKTVNDPSKAPPRADVVKSLQNGIVLNLLGMGAAILGMQATVGTLVAKALTTSANLYSRSGSSPVIALDIFLVQASANVILSHFLGLVLSSELLRSVTVSSSEPVRKVSL